ncbi:MAG: sulfotransferase, partial [Gammaproteobacteria bacterium]|nr:sulfotransferase [Gammaproteobacteria bacterium]
CERIGLRRRRLPHRRRAAGRADYRGYYDDATAERVAEHFRPDIELFGYSFD